MAGVTGLEPAASGVTGRRSNQLSYYPLRGEEAETSFEGFEVKRCFLIFDVMMKLVSLSLDKLGQKQIQRLAFYTTSIQQFD